MAKTKNEQFDCGNIAGVRFRVGHYYYSPVTEKTYRCVDTRKAAYEGHDVVNIGTFIEDESCKVEAIFIDNKRVYGFRVGDDGIIYFIGDGNMPVIDRDTMKPVTSDSNRVDIRDVYETPVSINIAP